MVIYKHLLALMLLAGTWMNVATAQEAKDEAAQVGLEQNTKDQAAVAPDNASKAKAEKNARLEAATRAMQEFSEKVEHMKAAQSSQVQTEEHAAINSKQAKDQAAQVGAGQDVQAQAPVQAITETGNVAEPEAEKKARLEAEAKEMQRFSEEAARVKTAQSLQAKTEKQAAVKIKAGEQAAIKAKQAAGINAAKPKADKANVLLDTVQKAVLKDPEVLSRWDNFLAAVKETDAARGGYFPHVDLSVDKGRERYLLGSADPSLMSRRGVTLTLSQMLYDGFATRNEVRRLTSAQLTRYYELLDASETAALEAIRTYYDVSRYRKLFELTEDNYVTHRKAFEHIKQKVQAGVGRRVDLEQASGRLALSQSNMVLDNANIHDVSARFQRVIGELPPAVVISSEAQATQDKIDKMILPDAAAATISVAVESHPAILAAVENVRSARYDLNERSSKYQPNINLHISKANNFNYTGVPGPTDDAVAEVVMSWNLFDGGSDRARSSQYAKRLDAARDQREKACRDVRMNLAIAYNDISKLKEQLNYLDQHQMTIEKVVVGYQKQFDIGQRSLLDVLDSENELFQAKRNYVNAEYDLYIAQARTLAGMGRLVSSLGLARLETSDLPELLGVSSDGPENCPADPPLANTYSIDDLNDRALEALKHLAPAEHDTPDGSLPSPGMQGVPGDSSSAVPDSMTESDAKAAAEAELFMQNKNKIKAEDTKTKGAEEFEAARIKAEKKAKE
jgi:adhesin transport system outer membrane protein